MHKYMRAIGLSKITERKELQKLITGVILEGTERTYTSSGEEELLAEFCRDFGHDNENGSGASIGIAVCGEFDNDDKFTYDYYFPYLRGTHLSSEEDISVERHAAQESYAGVCDDVRIGVSLIFYLQNMIPYVKAKNSNILPVRGTTLTLSALSTEGTIMMPINKTEKDLKVKVNIYNNDKELIDNFILSNSDKIIKNLPDKDKEGYEQFSCNYELIAENLHYTKDGKCFMYSSIITEDGEIPVLKFFRLVKCTNCGNSESPIHIDKEYGVVCDYNTPDFDLDLFLCYITEEVKEYEYDISRTNQTDLKRT